MFIIVNSDTNLPLLDYTTGERSEFTNYDEAVRVMETMRRHTIHPYHIEEAS